MPFQIRRIVTARDGRGKSVVASDTSIAFTPGKIDASLSGADIWWTHAVPAEIGEDALCTEPTPGMPGSGGTLLKVLEIPPGTKPLMHRTETLDYVIVMEGEIVMLLDDGSDVGMKAGDIMIQRATVHGWTNRSDVPCRIAFVLVDARRT